MTLLKTLHNYDRNQRRYIKKLEADNENLRQQVNELTSQLVQAVATSDKMKLDLIMNGCLRKPED